MNAPGECGDPYCTQCHPPDDCPACREEREPLVYTKTGLLKFVPVPEMDLEA